MCKASPPVCYLNSIRFCVTLWPRKVMKSYIAPNFRHSLCARGDERANRCARRLPQKSYRWVHERQFACRLPTRRFRQQRTLGLFTRGCRFTGLWLGNRTRDMNQNRPVQTLQPTAWGCCISAVSKKEAKFVPRSVRNLLDCWAHTLASKN